MKNNFINLLLTIILITMFIYIFMYSKNVKESVIYAENIWINNLIPSILPSLLIVSLLIEYNLIDKINDILGFIFERIYNLPKNASFVILISMVTGFPTGSKYVRNLLDKCLIDEESANHLIMFTSYSNPIFVISFIGETLLGNRKLGIMIYLTHLLSGLLIGYLFRNKRKRINNINVLKERNNSFINNLVNIINDSFSILINMLGIIIFFLIIISIIDKLLPESIITKIIESFIEITIGITSISKYKINLRLKTSLIGMILSFNGLSIHFQTKSIIEGSRIKYHKYLIARVLHSLLCFFFLYFFFYMSY